VTPLIYDASAYLDMASSEAGERSPRVRKCIAETGQSTRRRDIKVAVARATGIPVCVWSVKSVKSVISHPHPQYHRQWYHNTYTNQEAYTRARFMDQDRKPLTSLTSLTERSPSYAVPCMWLRSRELNLTSHHP
jgi:crotonobetainyl-CoA:carnitine CoA-transferase CaiB-like acyl-CoA transferase